MERKLLQIAVAVAGLSGVIAGLIFVPLLWLWQRDVARVAQRSAVS